MKFTSPSGRTYNWDKPTPPTQADIDALVAYDAQQGQPTQEAPQFAASPYGIGAGMKPSPYLQETTEMALRYGVPAVVAMGTGGASIPIQMAAGGLSGAFGEAGARKAAGQEVLTREGLSEVSKAAALNFIPLRRGAQVLETAATMGGGTALAEALGATIAGREMGDAPLVAGSIGAGLGGGFGAIAKGVGRISSKAVEDASVQGLMRDIGIEKPALAQIRPEFAPMSNRQAAQNPALANQLASTESQITRQAFDMVGNVPSNSELAAQMAPFASTAARVESVLKQANAEYAASTSRLSALEAQPQPTAAYQEAYESAALSKLLAARKQAAATFAAQQNFGQAVSIGAHANDLTRGFSQLDGAVKDISSAFYSKTGLDGNSPIISRAELMASAKRSLDDSSGPIGQAILDSIANVGRADGVAPERLSWNQFKNLRDEMSSRWTAFDENYVNRAERDAGMVYKSLGDTFRDSIKTTLGEDSAKAFDAAQRYWYEWSQTRSSNFTRPIFQTPRVIINRAGQEEVVSGITEDSLSGLAKGLLEGKGAQAIANINGAIRLVEKYSPESANTIKATVGRAVRGTLIEQNRNDPAGLVTALAEQAQKEDLRPFIELAGFGDKAKLTELAKAMRSYKKEELTPAVIDEALAASSAALGLKNAVVMQEVRDAAATAVAGVGEKSAKKLESARNRAIKAGIDLKTVESEYNKIINDPIMSVFTGRGTYKFSEEAGKVGKGTLSDFVLSLSPEVGQRFMGGLRQKNSQLAEMLSRKILADELYRMSGIERKAKDATSKVDIDKLRRFWSPSLPQDKQRSEHIRKLVGDVLDDRFKRFFTSLEKAVPTLKEANLVTRDTGAPIASTIAGAAQPVVQIPGLSPLGVAAISSRIQRILEKPYFDLMTYMATDPSFLVAASKAENFAAAVKSLPVQRAFLYLASNGLATDMAQADEQSKRPRQ